MPKHKLNVDLIETICTRIRAGADLSVALESLGIPWSIGKQWLRISKVPRCSNIYTMFAERTMQASAEIRLMAQKEVREKDVKFWLVQGPGRDPHAQQPTPVAARPAPHSPPPPDMTEAETRFMELVAVILKALTPYTEARIAAAAAIAQMPGSSLLPKSMREKKG